MDSILGSVTDGLTIAKYKDWLVFVQRLKKLVGAGRIRAISPPKTSQFADGDEWYLDPETGEIYVHGIPNAPRLPSWTRFDSSAPTEPKVHANDLSVIPSGSKTRLEVRGLKGILDFLIREGSVEAIDSSNVPAKEDTKEKWFKDLRTDTVYRLIETSGDEGNLWERLPLRELQLKVQ